MKLNKFMIFLLIINFGIEAAQSIDLPDEKRIALSNFSPVLVKYQSDKRTFDLSFGNNGQAEIPTISNPKNLELRYNPNTGSIFVSDKEKGDMVVFDQNGKIKPELTKRGKDEFGNDDSNLINLDSLAFNTQEEAEAAGWNINHQNKFNELDELVIVKMPVNDGYKWLYGKTRGRNLDHPQLLLWKIYVPGQDTLSTRAINIGRHQISEENQGPEVE
ncbi:MAG: hypothetical protein P4L22_00800 [Candidatus Babeliales bacterium]|nr:hypothetical protein [Candidatus Babeliales bacterium]